MRAETRFNYRLLIDWYRILLYIIITFMLKSLSGAFVGDRISTESHLNKILLVVLET